jgi:hypothetical protein
MVVSETCKGYACGERVLRPAKVVVAKEPCRSQKSDDTECRPERSEGSLDTTILRCAQNDTHPGRARSQSAEVTDEEPGEVAEAGSGSNG